MSARQAAAFNTLHLVQREGSWVGLYLLNVDVDIPCGGREVYFEKTVTHSKFSYTVTDVPVGLVTQIGGDKDQIRIDIDDWGTERPTHIFYHPEKERFYVA